LLTDRWVLGMLERSEAAWMIPNMQIEWAASNPDPEKEQA
jgi:hypothetical protein